MAVRKERVHQTGKSNRPGDRTGTIHASAAGSGPIDLDSSIRSIKPGLMKYTMDQHVPLAAEGAGNKDFSHKLPGHDYRQPNSDMRETRRLAQETRERELQTQRLEAEKPSATITATDTLGKQLDETQKEPRQKGHQAAPRWNPAKFFEPPPYEKAPLTKDEGEAWNHLESSQVQGTLKGQDRLMRACRSRDDIDTPRSEGGAKHPLDGDKDEYYPGRSLIDAASQESGNDFQIRPINLPDFHNPPPPNADKASRMRRLREVLKQRYAGRPRLMGVFRNCCLHKQGFAFPKDLQMVFDQMGIKVEEDECDMLIRAVDKDRKGAVNFEEFADLILGSSVEVGGPSHQAQDRHVRAITKTLVQGLVERGQVLGKAFCELDPERRYMVSKAQFANAIGTAANHVSKQAIDFLWASQFPDDRGDLEHKVVDWRDFMSQLAHFAHAHRAPTPICVQGRKRQYDLLQRTAPITGGDPGAVDLHRPDQNNNDQIQIIADKLVQRPTDLPHKPREAALLTEPFVDVIRTKAHRAERALAARIPKARMQQLLKGREMVHQDELAEVIITELSAPNVQDALDPQVPLYTTHGTNVLTLDPSQIGPAAAAASFSATGDSLRAAVAAVASSAGMPAPAGGPASLKLVPADIHSYVSIQRVNREDEVHVGEFLSNLYKPEDERKVIDRVNDGLNRALRGHRPPRERPPNADVPRHMNYWQARYLMEALGDGIATVETSNGGQLKPSKMFKRLDIDGDGYISLSDLKTACEKYKIPHSSADLHAAFTELDKGDHGSVDIGEFTRNYQVHQGSVMDAMSRPIKAVYHEGGVEYAGPVQDKLDAQEREIAAMQAESDAAHRAHATGRSPPSRAASAPPSAVPSAAGSSRSQMSRTGASIATPSSIYEREVGLITGRARVTDVIRARCAAWKPAKHELYTAPARTRFGMTIFPDTRHVTEADMPLSGSYMAESERFKTTNNVKSIFSVPDPMNPQAEDTLRKHARNEFRIERIRQRQREFTERCWAANQAAQEFDEMKIARKALNQLNYERKTKMACA